MAEALRLVKSHFGPDAVILNTRVAGRGGLLGTAGRTTVEITAAPSSADLPAVLRRGTVSLSRRSTGKAEGAAGSVAILPDHSQSPRSEALLAELSQLKSMVGELTRETRRARSDVPNDLYDHFSSLVRNEVAEELARDLVERVRADLGSDRTVDPAAVQSRLATYIEAMLPITGPIRAGTPGNPAIVALVGPTGVGKTTTIAKLAANFCLREKRRPGLITIDTYRIAAVEQLRTYARIIDVPLEVVMSPAELRDAVRRLSDRDLILIDTAGRGQRDAVKIRELKLFFSAVKPSEIHLVLSGTARQSVLDEAIERFREVGLDRVIFTKLDEAVGFGVILNCLNKASARLSYVTTGQDVPDDILIAESRQLAGRILENADGTAQLGKRPLTGGTEP